MLQVCLCTNVGAKHCWAKPDTVYYSVVSAAHLCTRTWNSYVCMCMVPRPVAKEGSVNPPFDA